MKHISKLLSALLILALLAIPASAGVQNRDISLIADGNMEASGTTSWSSAGLGASTVTKEAGAYQSEGNQVLKIAYSSAISPSVAQNGVFQQGKTYRVRGCGAGDGVAGYPFIIIGNAQAIWNGVPTSTTPKCFDTTITSTSTQESLRLYCYNCTASGHYATYDNLSVTEVKGTIQNREVNLSVNGNYEAGTTGLTNGNGIVSSVSKFEPSAEGNLALRITYNTNSSIAWAYATIANLVAADSPVYVYRIRGMARGDGTVAPQITRTNNGGANCETLWTGTNSTATQYFDVTFNSSSCSNKIGLGASSNAAGYVEFDNVTHTRVMGAVQNREIQLLADGNMEASATGAFGASGATLSKELGSADLQGLRILRVMWASGVNAYATSGAILTAGHTYRIRGWARSGGTVTPTIDFASASYLHAFWTGTTSTSWQRIDVTMTAPATATILRFYALNSSGAGQYVEFDGMSVTRVY